MARLRKYSKAWAQVQRQRNGGVIVRCADCGGHRATKGQRWGCPVCGCVIGEVL